MRSRIYHCRPAQSGRRVARRPSAVATMALAAGFALVLCLASCASMRHQFAQLTTKWEARIGQLQYRGPRTSLIGEVLVRYSKAGDFELTFTKGPGVTLLMIRQDANFARVTGPLAHGSWSGPTERAPRRLRGWLALRAALLYSDKPALRQTTGRETFLFEF
jgi:hypothetical protein